MMKISDGATYIIIGTAAWIAASFAYVFGVFINYSVGYVGLLRLDDIIFGSTGAVCLIVGIFLPLLYAVVSFVYSISKSLEDVSYKKVILISCIVWAIVLGFYVYVIGRGIPIDPDVLSIVPSLAGSAAIFAGQAYDRHNKVATGRIVTSFLVILTLSFSVGSGPVVEGGSGRGVCDVAYKSNAEVGKGKLVFSAAGGIFIRGPKPTDLRFLPTGSFDRIDSSRCERG